MAQRPEIGRSNECPTKLNNHCGHHKHVVCTQPYPCSTSILNPEPYFFKFYGSKAIWMGMSNHFQASARAAAFAAASVALPAAPRARWGRSARHAARRFRKSFLEARDVKNGDFFYVKLTKETDHAKQILNIRVNITYNTKQDYAFWNLSWGFKVSRFSSVEVSHSWSHFGVASQRVLLEQRLT